MELHVSLTGRGDLAGQIYSQTKAAILDGRLRAGQVIPPSRELAARLAVSRNTVSVAYDRLTAEGFLTARVGVGTYVSDTFVDPCTEEQEEVGRAPRPLAVWDEIPDPPDMSRARATFDFRCGTPDISRFPFATWRSLVADQLRGEQFTDGLYGEPAGHYGLRTAIARHIGVARAVRTQPEDVVITNGIQHALDVISRVFLRPGDTVAVEDPGYPPARWLFQSLGARVVGVPVDANGMVVDALPDNARLVYVCPSHHFPLGVSMSLRRRLALLAWADRTGAVIIEDDYDSEFRYAGRPLDPLHSLDRAGRVLYLGSFSKTMLPTLRLGFCVTPPALRPVLRKAKFVSDWFTALPMQAALARFIDEGLFARHVRRMRAVYLARRDLITTLLARDHADVLTTSPSVAGMHLAATLRSGRVDHASRVARHAKKYDVRVNNMFDFWFDRPPQPGVVIGFGVIPLEKIPEGLERLRACIEDIATTS